jgi:DNA ligase-1
MQIQKPMLASAFDPDKAQYPYLATPKIDGIRFLIVDGQAVSRSFKPIRNRYIQEALQCLPEGIDGEITCGDSFQSSTSGVMSYDGEPDFHVWIFDYVECGPDVILPYNERMRQLEELDALGEFEELDRERYTILYPDPVEDLERVQELMENYTAAGYEGVMLRDPKGTYKFGRSSVKEGIILKVKEFIDDEGVIVGFKEKMSNQNEAVRNQWGYIERKGGRGGFIPANTLGAFILDYNGQQLQCGSGLNDEQRKDIWENQDAYVGKLVKFKYMSHGVKDLPRHPIFLGFRDPDDMN